MASENVGLVGVGVMGRKMVKNLVASGYTVNLWDQSADALAKGEELGGVRKESAAAVSDGAESVFTILPDGPDVERVVLGKDGILEGAGQGTTVIDCSTIHPDVSLAIRSQVESAGCEMVDSGMVGGPTPFFLVVGGKQEVFDRNLALITAATDSPPLYCGGPGSGHTMKLIINLLGLSIFAANLEAISLGIKAGLDRELVVEALSRGATDNWSLHHAVKDQVFAGNFIPGMRASLGHKDLRLANQLAAELAVPLSVLAPALHAYSSVLASGSGDESTGVLGRVIEERAGITGLVGLTEAPS